MKISIITTIVLSSLIGVAAAQEWDERLERPIEVRDSNGNVTRLPVNTASGWSYVDPTRHDLDVKPFAADGGASSSENAASSEAE